VKICSTVVTILVLFVLGLSSEQAFANSSSFSPDFETGIDTMGVFGSNYFLQTVSARGSVHVSGYSADDDAATMVGGAEGKSNDYRRLMVDQTPFVSELTWMLGYAYYESGASDPLLGGEQVNDEAHAIRLGVAWNVSRTFDVEASGTYQVIPVENYSQGIFDIRGGYTISLAEKPHHDEIIGDDAEAYYLRQAQRAAEVVAPPQDSFPNIRIGGSFVFTQQDKGPETTTGRVGVGLTSDVYLNQAGSGPDITFALNKQLKFKFEFLLYYYDTNVQNFLVQNTTIGEFRPRAGLAVANIEDTTPLLLTFPYRSITESFTYDLSPSTRINGALQQSTYFATTGYPLTNSIGGTISQKLSKKLRAGGALDFTASTGYSELVGGFSLGYDL
jgi:hypothetical protein